MFDIKDYLDYKNLKSDVIDYDVDDLDTDLNDDINTLLTNRFDRLYLHDRYRYGNKNINIIYPSLAYPGNQSLILSADKIRYLLSFYPDKNELGKINKIVLRPRFIEAGDIELVSLYMRQKRILVMYLIHPHLYRIKSSRFSRYSDFISIDLESIANSKITGKKIKKDDDSEIFIHPLWYIISVIPFGGDNKIDKFFIRKRINRGRYEALNDISYFYSRHGY